MTDKATQIVMVIDDDYTMVELIIEILRNDGWCAFITTTQPEKAVEYLNDKKNALPALIITDNEMGAITGKDIIKLAQDKNIPAVLISGELQANLIAQKYGAKFMSKPFSIQVFRNAIAAAVS